MLTQERLKELLRYDPDTGLFWWVIPRPGVCVSRPAGHTTKRDGYVVVTVDRYNVRAHRLAWLYMTGRWPDQEIDHINNAKDDNRWINLRDVDRVTNQHNVLHARKDSRSRLVGAHKTPVDRYMARITLQSKIMYLGTYDTAEQAHAVYLEAKKKYHKQ